MTACKVLINDTVTDLNVTIRPLMTCDVPRIKHLCELWFPIHYPDRWFLDITSDPKFFAIAAVNANEVIGFIVADIKRQSTCNTEDVGLVSKGCGSDPFVAYILSLGVVTESRRNGIASLLLSNLVKHLNDKEYDKCKAIYLHVLSSNVGAIEFYEKQQFSLFKRLPLYYFINGQCKDGLTYVKYINNGRPPFTLFSCVKIIPKYLLQFSLSLVKSITLLNCFVQRKYSSIASVNAQPANCSRLMNRFARLILKRNQRTSRYQHLTSA